MKLKQITVKNSMTKSVFPEVELLLEDEKYVEALRKFNNFDEYDDIIDFIFVEMFPTYKTKYIEYKEKDGTKLMTSPSITKNILKIWDKKLCKCVKIAYKHMSWTNFTKDCDRL